VYIYINTHGRVLRVTYNMTRALNSDGIFTHVRRITNEFYTFSSIADDLYKYLGECDEADYWIIHEPFATSAYCLYRCRYDRKSRTRRIRFCCVMYLYTYTYTRDRHDTPNWEFAHVLTKRILFSFRFTSLLLCGVDLPRRAKSERYIFYACTYAHGWPVIIYYYYY